MNLEHSSAEMFMCTSSTTEAKRDRIGLPVITVKLPIASLIYLDPQSKRSSWLGGIGVFLTRKLNKPEEGPR